MPRIGCIAAGLILAVLIAGQASAGPLTDRLYDATGIELAGFYDLRAGTRLQNDPAEKQLSLAEGRMRLELDREWEAAILAFKGDLLADAISDSADLEIRELSLTALPLDFLDLKIGRATFTWGTGDLIFINDTFAKDWQSFFIGRNDEYLKRPENGIKVSLFSGLADLDIIYMPLFEGSRFITGHRLSYYNPATGGTAGRDLQVISDQPDRWFKDDALHLRLSRTLGALELALYGYSGFWQEPEGFDPLAGQAFFPRLNVYGGSARTALFGGIANLEMGYYDSRDNSDSTNPFVRPSEWRFLAGYEHELAHELTGSIQYYLESIQHYDRYAQSLPEGMARRKHNTSTLTLRLSQLALEQNLILSLFLYYSPTRDDGYARPGFSYKLTDQWLVDGGLNLFWGRNLSSFWGQFENNTNIFCGIRYTF
jgi:hypothetical protein